jgi:hypothetical protein
MSETMPLTANKVDETFLFDGARLRVVLSGEATGGKISILYAVMPPPFTRRGDAVRSGRDVAN